MRSASPFLDFCIGVVACLYRRDKGRFTDTENGECDAFRGMCPNCAVICAHAGPVSCVGIGRALGSSGGGSPDARLNAKTPHPP